jgi:hypothetical protein
MFPWATEMDSSRVGWGRRGRQDRAGRGRQVGQQDLELSVGTRRQRGLEPLVKFVSGEPAVPRRDSQLLRYLVAVLVRHAQVPSVRRQFSRHNPYCNVRRNPLISSAANIPAALS